MKNTTLCYVEKDGKYLMLHRIKKENDENRDKWIGIGGKFESGESPFDCARREILEETGLKANKLIYKGIVTFVSDEYGTEYMHLFTCRDFFGTVIEDCDEGVLEWIDKNALLALPMWEGDKIFLSLLDSEERFFSLKLQYEKDKLVAHTLEY
jgi:8-oxo-dGTP diphosphatase